MIIYTHHTPRNLLPIAVQASINMSRKSSLRGRSSGGNNNTYPSDWETGSRDTMSFKKLSEDEKITLVRASI